MAKKYSCKNCGAELYFDPKRQMLHCEYCDSDYDPSEYAMEAEEASGEDEVIPQQPVEGTNRKDAAKAEEGSVATDDSLSNEDLVIYQCPNCKAEVITENKTVATTCVYCNRAITLAGNVTGEFQPDYVLPFVIERDQVEEAYKNLCKKSFLTPKLFVKDSTIEKIKGMYIPYWLYSFEGRGDLSIEAENRRVHRSGDREVTEVSSYEIDESGSAQFDRVPADALVKVDNDLMDSIEPYDFGEMKPFNPAYLTGFYAQRWDDSAEDNRDRAKLRAKESLMQEILAHAGSYDSRKIRREHIEWNQEKIEYVMLPVWMMYTEYKGETYLFAMNGQTGKILGEIPQDKSKLIKTAAAVFFISQLILLILRIMGVML